MPWPRRCVNSGPWPPSAITLRAARPTSALTAAPLHLPSEHPRHVVLAGSDRELGEGGRDRVFGDRNRAADQLNLLGEFDDPQPLGDGGGIGELPAPQDVLQAEVGVEGGGRLERDGPREARLAGSEDL